MESTLTVCRYLYEGSTFSSVVLKDHECWYYVRTTKLVREASFYIYSPHLLWVQTLKTILTIWHYNSVNRGRMDLMEKDV